MADALVSRAAAPPPAAPPAAAPPPAAGPPGAGPLLAAQVRYQLTLLMRTPHAMIFGLVIPVLLLAVRSNNFRGDPRLEYSALAGAAVFGLLVTAAAWS